MGELDVVESHTTEEQDMPEDLLGIVSVPTDDTLSTSGIVGP